MALTLKKAKEVFAHGVVNQAGFSSYGVSSMLRQMDTGTEIDRRMCLCEHAETEHLSQHGGVSNCVEPNCGCKEFVYKETLPEKP